jgi:hypothetical protein
MLLSCFRVTGQGVEAVSPVTIAPKHREPRVLAMEGQRVAGLDCRNEVRRLIRVNSHEG